MSVFNVREQNENLNGKIVAGLERLSQVFRILLWEKAKAFSLSPIQIQLLIFIRYHSVEKTTVSHLAKEFAFTKPTISDAVRVLELKGLVRKEANTEDARSYQIQLTPSGTAIVAETEGFVNPITDVIATLDDNSKRILWEHISKLISVLNKTGIITVQRTCFNCRHYVFQEGAPFCALLNQTLFPKDIRIDCDEFIPS